MRSTSTPTLRGPDDRRVAAIVNRWQTMALKLGWGTSRWHSTRRSLSLVPVPGQHRKGAFFARALQGNGNGKAQSSDEYRGGLDPRLEMAMPADQRPVNELAALRTNFLDSWVGTAFLYGHINPLSV
jgi:hypothetical protein